MTTYHVTANACDFGMIEASNAQEARDKAAQMAGYESEAEMVERLEQPSAIVAVAADDDELEQARRDLDDLPSLTLAGACWADQHRK